MENSTREYDNHSNDNNIQNTPPDIATMKTEYIKTKNKLDLYKGPDEDGVLTQKDLAQLRLQYQNQEQRLVSDITAIEKQLRQMSNSIEEAFDLDSNPQAKALFDQINKGLSEIQTVLTELATNSVSSTTSDREMGKTTEISIDDLMTKFTDRLHSTNNEWPATKYLLETGRKPTVKTLEEYYQQNGKFSQTAIMFELYELREQCKTCKARNTEIISRINKVNQSNRGQEIYNELVKMDSFNFTSIPQNDIMYVKQQGNRLLFNDTIKLIDNNGVQSLDTSTSQFSTQLNGVFIKDDNGNSSTYVERNNVKNCFITKRIVIIENNQNLLNVVQQNQTPELNNTQKIDRGIQRAQQIAQIPASAILAASALVSSGLVLVNAPRTLAQQARTTHANLRALGEEGNNIRDGRENP